MRLSSLFRENLINDLLENGLLLGPDNDILWKQNLMNYVK